MSTNCLVTTLKSNVDNENLPLFGKVILKLEHVDNPTVNDEWFSIAAGENGLKVTLVNTTFKDAAYAGLSEMTITTPNGFLSNHIDLTGNNMSIVVEAYNIRGVQQSHVTDIKGSDSLIYGAFNNGRYAENPHSVKEIIASVLEHKNNIKFYSLGTTLPMSEQTINNNINTLLYADSINNTALIRNSSILQFVVLNDSDGCNIEDIPVSILGIDCNRCKGSVTTLVNKFRAAGRTTGKIRTVWLQNSACTIDDGSGNEITVKQYATDHGISSSTASCYLVWTNNSIELTADGTGAETYSIAFTDTRYI